MAFPANPPEWATSDTYSDGVTPNKIRPDTTLRQYGYAPEAEPTAQELNWQLNNLMLQIEELKTIATSARQVPVNELVFIDGDTRNPAVIYGYGTWVPYAQGRVLIGAGQGTDVNGTTRSFTVGNTGGEYTHTQSINEVANHSHAFKNNYMLENAASVTGVPDSNKQLVGFINGGVGAGRTDTDNNTLVFTNDTTASAGASQAMNVMQPFLVLQIWRRTA
jgi:microcystin-dependent protein